MREPDRPRRREPELPPGLHGAASPRAGPVYRLVRRALRVAFAALGFRVEVRGLAHLGALPRRPDGALAGGWIAAGLPHRTWIDPFVVWAVLPAEPRLVFFGDARAMARSRWRRLGIRLLGGVIPIPYGGGPRSFATNLAAADAVLRSGGVFFLLPEVGDPVPPGTARPLGGGLGYVALRSGSPILPIVLGGTHELFLGRRIVVDVLPPVTAAELAGLAPDAPSPEPGGREDRLAAHRVVESLHRRTAAAVAQAHERAEPRPGARRRLRRLTTLFR